MCCIIFWYFRGSLRPALQSGFKKSKQTHDSPPNRFLSCISRLPSITVMNKVRFLCYSSCFSRSHGTLGLNFTTEHNLPIYLFHLIVDTKSACALYTSKYGNIKKSFFIDMSKLEKNNLFKDFKEINSCLKLLIYSSRLNRFYQWVNHPQMSISMDLLQTPAWDLWIVDSYIKAPENHDERKCKV